ncbi:MAG: SpoIIE family protein phosphatase [Nocardioidaceae bacterium]
MSRTTDPRTPGLLEPAAERGAQERLQQASDRAAYLARVSRGLSGAMHTDRAVDLVLEMLVGPLVDWAQLTILDRREHLFRSRSLDGADDSARLPADEIPPGSSLARVLSTGVTDLVMVPDGADTDSPSLVSAVPSADLRERLTSIRPMDLLTIALSARGTTYGALTIAQRGGHGFDAETVAFLEDFAHWVAVTLDTTRALAESRRVTAVLSRELTPPQLPVLTGVEFATYYRVAFEQEALGGDFYDVHGTDEDWTVVVGDVCGKGVEAAVLTGKVRQAVRTVCLVDRDPARVLDLANRVLLTGSDETFVTAICARGRRVGDGLHLEIAAAGHPEPLVVRADGSVEEVAVGGTVLGLLEESRYSSVGLDLGIGETCLFYTDGVPEAPGHRSRFGDDRMRELLEATGACAVQAQVEGIAMALSAHLSDRAHDDIAILAVQASEVR